MSDHAKLSPSARHRWGRCPGSVRMEAQYPEGGTASAAAVDGTHSHTLLEYCVKRLITGLDGKAEAFVGVTLKDDDGEFTVDAARAERVEFAMEYIRSRAFLLGATVKAEEQVDPKYLIGRDDLSGTVDVQLMKRAPNESSSLWSTSGHGASCLGQQLSLRRRSIRST